MKPTRPGGSAAPAPRPRDLFTEAVQVAFVGERAFVKHPNGRWFESGFSAHPAFRFFPGSAYYGEELPPPARTHHRVMHSVGIWWCLGCNAQGRGAPPLHPRSRKEVPA